nr:hypothetical protein CFP56_38917 [Quercus suber]
MRLTCGYEASLFFDCDQGTSAGTGRFRRPLLSLQQREEMSDKLKAAVPPHLVLWCVEQIDDQSEHVRPSEDVEFSRCPFGVFRANETEASSSSCSPDDFEVHLQSQLQDTTFQLYEQFGHLQDTAWSPNTQVILEAFFEQPEFQNPGIWYESTDCRRMQEIVGNDSNNRSVDELTDSNPRNEANVDSLQPMTDLPIGIVVSRTSTPINLQIDIPQSAAYLAKHYLEHVLKFLTPFQHSKTPWHVLFVPEMKKCLAGLALQEKQDSASLAVFYGMLAISALSLDGITHLQCWSAHGKNYHRRAYLYV